MDAAGAWGGSLGRAMTGGCARRRAAAAGAVATRTGREKAPPVWGWRGLLEVNLIRFYFLEPRQIHLEALQDR